MENSKKKTNILAILSTFFVALVLIGAGCTANVQVDKTPAPAPTPASTSTPQPLPAPADQACVKEGFPPTGPCCEGLEPVAVDHAYSACQKIGTPGWKAKACGEEGDTPNVDTPNCCKGLEPIQMNGKNYCLRQQSQGPIDPYKNPGPFAKVIGSYQQYSPEKLAFAGGSNMVVLFFAASWCPTCQTLDKNLKDNDIPAGLTVLKVDYDTSTELKKKYGVTYQHTLVLVDSDGNLISKWSGGSNVSDIMKQAIDGLNKK